MTLTTHAAMGAVIGHASGNPLLGFVLSFIVHLLVDMIPHGDTGMSDNFRVHQVKQKQAIAYVAFDAIFAILFILFIINTKEISNLQALSWGIAGGILPDLMVGVYEIKKTKLLAWFHDVHFFFHDFFVKKKGDVPLFYSLLAQLILVVYLQSKL